MESSQFFAPVPNRSWQSLRAALVSAGCLLAALSCARAEVDVITHTEGNAVKNPGFEACLKDWQPLLPPETKPGSVKSEAAITGQHYGDYCLRMETLEPARFAYRSAPLAVGAGKRYKLSAWVRVPSGFPANSGQFAVAARVDTDVSTGNHLVVAAPVSKGPSTKEWSRVEGTFEVPNGVREVYVDLCILSGKGEVFWDEIEVLPADDSARAWSLGFNRNWSKLPCGERPPWDGSYKIKPSEKEKLTAADVVGPDGIVYPDWRMAGVNGGIPKVPVVAKLEDYGVKPDVDKDCSEAIERAAAAVGKRGGGAILLGRGTYYLDRPVVISENGVVLRGAGQDQTKVLFRYSGPKEGVRFYSPAEGETVDANTWVEIHAAPTDLKELKIGVDERIVGVTTYYPNHWGGTFSYRTGGGNILKKAGPGKHMLKAFATYADGHVAESQIEVNLTNEKPAHPRLIPSEIGAIMFLGQGKIGSPILLAKDGLRGETELELTPDHDLKAGDKIHLSGPATPRWKELTKNACQWGVYRENEYKIVAVSGNRVRLNQPLRIEFPTIDGSFVQKLVPITRCAVEDFTLEQTNRLWTSGIIFSNAWDCWAQRVTVNKAGRFPLYFKPAKFCELRDSTFDGAWYHGGGGTAYIGWEHAYDCLMENVTTYHLRHSPLVQWSAAGNVVRNSTFYDNDGQWHSGWTNENLFENCVIYSTIGNGGYGYGLWASPPEDTAHGPNGPRNVVYNCDISSQKAGLWMGGMNEGWLILYNRFNVECGPGVIAKSASFNHTIKGNVFCLKNPGPSALVLGTPDCIDVDFTDNKIYGADKVYSGEAALSSDANNLTFPYQLAPRPALAVPSIFEWERKQAKTAGEKK